MSLDLFTIHQFDDENTPDEPQRLRMAGDGPGAGMPDPDSGSLTLEHYDGDGECRSVEELTEYDRLTM